MIRNAYFDHHPLFSKLKYQEIVGIIQLLTDAGFLKESECKGFYVKFMDLRSYAAVIYDQFDQDDIKELIGYLRYKAYLDYRGSEFS